MEDGDDNLAAVSPFLRQQITQQFLHLNRMSSGNASVHDPANQSASPITRPSSTNVTWSSLSNQPSGTPVPEISGIYNDPEVNLIPFVGTDLDATENVFGYNELLSSWECDVMVFQPSYVNKQGPVYIDPFCQIFLKDSHKMEEVCTT